MPSVQAAPLFKKEQLRDAGSEKVQQKPTDNQLDGLVPELAKKYLKRKIDILERRRIYFKRSRTLQRGCAAPPSSNTLQTLQ